MTLAILVLTGINFFWLCLLTVCVARIWERQIEERQRVCISKAVELESMANQAAEKVEKKAVVDADKLDERAVSEAVKIEEKAAGKARGLELTADEVARMLAKPKVT